jgi:leucyl/phenylalanyl-tRNA--protein transferase
MRKTSFVIKADTAFRDVMAGCAKAKRQGQSGTWITRDMIDGYCALHDEGLCHSIEAWDGERLVGGLYGVSFGSVFFGESMFARAPDASKIAFATLVANLLREGFTLIDCQSYTDHLARFGAIEMPRPQFLATLQEGLKTPTKTGPWSLPLQPAAAVDWLEGQGIG